MSVNKNLVCDHGKNIYNPNPNVDIEGLRPIAIDGSNVAVGWEKHLMMCVDICNLVA